jgi:hypothetical protein
LSFEHKKESLPRLGKNSNSGREYTKTILVDASFDPVPMPTRAETMAAEAIMAFTFMGIVAASLWAFYTN